MHYYQQIEGKLQEAIHNTETFHTKLVFYDTCQHQYLLMLSYVMKEMLDLSWNHIKLESYAKSETNITFTRHYWWKITGDRVNGDP